MAIIGVLKAILCDCFFNIYVIDNLDNLISKEDKYTLGYIEYVLFLSSSTLKRKVKLMNKIIKIVNEKVTI